MLTKPAVIGGVAAIVGAGVALAIAFVLFGRPEAVGQHVTANPTPVATGSKLGPRLELSERVFNLAGNSPLYGQQYLKLQVTIEFETTDERWANVLRGCVTTVPQPSTASVLIVSRLPTAPSPSPSDPVEGPEDSDATSPCAAAERGLLHEFELEVGTGRYLLEDAITTIVTAKTLAEVSTVDGKEGLKSEIKTATEKLLGEEFRVTRVLFGNFITQ